MNNVNVLLPPGTNPQPYVDWPDFARGSLLVRTVGVSSYDSLQTKFQRRYHNGLQFLVSYTLSDAKTNAGDSLSGGGVGGLRAPDVDGWDLKNDIGLSGFHTKHAFVVSGNYDLPGSGPIFGGWRTNWVFSMYSGQAQTINCSPATGAGTRLLRPGGRRSVRGQPRRGAVLQPGRLREPESGHDDRADRFQPPRRQAEPGDRSADDAAGLGFAKQFGLGARRRLEVRAEAFNLTNTPAFNLPGSLNFLDARNFASITSMRNTPRQIQLGAKIYW